MGGALRILGDFLVEDSGQDAAEYAILAALGALAALVAWQLVASAVSGAYVTADTSVQGLADTPNPR